MTPRTLSIGAGALLAIAAAYIPGCDERDVPFYSDEEEIERYIYESEDAVELFRVDNLIPPEPYELPWDPGVEYIREVDSTRRTVSIQLSPENKLRKVGSLPAYYRDAEVTIDDILYITELRIESAETTTTHSTEALNRYGYMLKLGADNQPYLGWKLWGYHGGTGTVDQGIEVTLMVRSQRSGTFPGNSAAYDEFVYVYPETLWEEGVPRETLITRQTVRRYRRTDQIATMSSGDSMVVSAQWNRTAAYFLSAYSANGLEVGRLEPSTATAETLVVHTPSPNPRNWNVVAVQEFLRRPIAGSNPPEYTVTFAAWTFPYRAPE